MGTGVGADGLRLSRLLQLASPSLPIGAYSYSSGLETAIDQGLVADETSAFDWIADAVDLVLGRWDAAIVAATVRTGEPNEIADLDSLALAGRETAELRLEAEQTGYSLAAWLRQVPVEGEDGTVPALAAVPGTVIDAVSGTLSEADVATTPASSGPVVFGQAARELGLPAETAALAWLWGFAENQVMVLIKTVPLGQIAGQRLLWRLGPVVEAAAASAATLPRERWTNAGPGLAIASMAHERQYSRLFRS